MPVRGLEEASGSRRSHLGPLRDAESSAAHRYMVPAFPLLPSSVDLLVLILLFNIIPLVLINLILIEILLS